MKDLAEFKTQCVSGCVWLKVEHFTRPATVTTSVGWYIVSEIELTNGVSVF